MMHVSCGADLLTICVSNTDDINSTCFGTTVGEEFYAQCDTLDKILTLFRSFSILKKAGASFNDKKMVDSILI